MVSVGRKGVVLLGDELEERETTQTFIFGSALDGGESARRNTSASEGNVQDRQVWRDK